MPEDELTEFNSNLASLKRVDELLRRCADATFMDDNHSKFMWLMNLRKEAMYKMTGKHKEDRTKAVNDWDKLVTRHTIWRRYPNNISLTFTFKKELDEYEIFLRDFMGAKGMLLKDGFDDKGL